MILHPEFYIIDYLYVALKTLSSQYTTQKKELFVSTYHLFAQATQTKWRWDAQYQCAENRLSMGNCIKVWFGNCVTIFHADQQLTAVFTTV